MESLSAMHLVVSRGCRSFHSSSLVNKAKCWPGSLDPLEHGGLKFRSMARVKFSECPAHVLVFFTSFSPDIGDGAHFQKHPTWRMHGMGAPIPRHIRSACTGSGISSVRIMFSVPVPDLTTGTNCAPSDSSSESSNLISQFGKMSMRAAVIGASGAAFNLFKVIPDFHSRSSERGEGAPANATNLCHTGFDLILLPRESVYYSRES